MREISLKDLLEAGCHFGHQTTRWNPKMKPYIFSARDGIHIFDLVKTKEGLELACKYLKETVGQGGQILFIGTKRQAKDINEAAAKKVGMPYLSRKWIGGLLTNWDYVGKRIDYLKKLKTDKASGKYKEYTKKENLMIDREIGKLELEFGGISNLRSVPAAIFVLDAKKDSDAIKEANICHAKVISIVDTNTNPDNVDFPIPANDDAVKSVQLVIDYITEAIEEGQKQIKDLELQRNPDIGGKISKIKADEEKKNENGKLKVNEEKKGEGEKLEVGSAKPETVKEVKVEEKKEIKEPEKKIEKKEVKKKTVKKEKK